MGLITECIDVMKVGHDGDARASSEPYETHPLAVAGIYRSVLPRDYLGQGVCLIHDVVENSAIRVAEIASFLDREVGFMVDALSKRHPSDFRSREDRVKEYHSRLLPAARKDKRLAMVKICDRIHNVITIDALSYERAVKILNETERVLLPFFRSLNLPLTEDLGRLVVQQRMRLGRNGGQRVLV